MRLILCKRTVGYKNATSDGYNMIQYKNHVLKDKYFRYLHFLWRQLCEVRKDIQEFQNIYMFMGLYETHGIRRKCREKQLTQKYGIYVLIVVVNKGSAE
jgi:hypothetical protein